MKKFRLALVPCETWSSENTYNRLDVVSDGANNIYVSRVADNTAALTDTASWWQMLDATLLAKASTDAAAACKEQTTLCETATANAETATEASKTQTEACKEATEAAEAATQLSYTVISTTDDIETD